MFNLKKTLSSGDEKYDFAMTKETNWLAWKALFECQDFFLVSVCFSGAAQSFDAFGRLEGEFSVILKGFSRMSHVAPRAAIKPRCLKSRLTSHVYHFTK